MPPLLELTRIRYRDKLQYSIYMDERLGGYNIMKLSVQPIIENYLVHGLGLDRTDNHIIIEVESVEEDLVIRIADNGKGIEPERLQQIQKELRQSAIQEHGSLGLKMSMTACGYCMETSTGLRWKVFLVPARRSPFGCL